MTFSDGLDAGTFSDTVAKDAYTARDVMKRTIDTYRAQDVGGTRVMGLQLNATTPFPKDLPDDARVDVQRTHGDMIADALYQHLPGGVLDQVLIGLLTRTATALVVRR